MRSCSGPVAPTRTDAIALLGLGLAVGLAPEDVPGFTAPEDHGMHGAGGEAEMAPDRDLWVQRPEQDSNLRPTP